MSGQAPLPNPQCVNCGNHGFAHGVMITDRAGRVFCNSDCGWSYIFRCADARAAYAPPQSDYQTSEPLAVSYPVEHAEVVASPAEAPPVETPHLATVESSGPRTDEAEQPVESQRQVSGTVGSDAPLESDYPPISTISHNPASGHEVNASSRVPDTIPRKDTSSADSSSSAVGCTAAQEETVSHQELSESSRSDTVNMVLLGSKTLDTVPVSESTSYVSIPGLQVSTAHGSWPNRLVSHPPEDPLDYVGLVAPSECGSDASSSADHSGRDAVPRRTPLDIGDDSWNVNVAAGEPAAPLSSSVPYLQPSSYNAMYDYHSSCLSFK